MSGLHDNGRPCNTNAHTVTTLWEGNKLKNTIIPGQEYKKTQPLDGKWQINTSLQLLLNTDSHGDLVQARAEIKAKMGWNAAKQSQQHQGWQDWTGCGRKNHGRVWNSTCCRWAVVITWDEGELLCHDRCLRLWWGCLTGCWSTCCAPFCSLCCGMFTSSNVTQLSSVKYRPEVGILRPEGQMRPDELFNPVRRAFAISGCQFDGLENGSDSPFT